MGGRPSKRAASTPHPLTSLIDPTRPKNKQTSGDPVDIRKLEKEELEELYEAVLLAAERLTRSATVAEDLTQKTFEALLTTRPWDESRPTSLGRHLYGIVKSLTGADP